MMNLLVVSIICSLLFTWILWHKVIEAPMKDDEEMNGDLNTEQDED